jgi:predicted XRE-type DNA-binding protein
MNPYEIDYSKLKESKKITEERDLLKLNLLAELNNIISKMETQKILDLTGLDKSDLSRIRISDFQRFSIDRIIKIFSRLGYKAQFSIVRQKKAS